MNQRPFHVKDCALIPRMAGVYPAVSLRELRARVETCPTASLYHHFCETRLRPSFDDPEFSNDFAAWSARSLGDSVLAERLEIINPFDYTELEDLRDAVLDIIDDRLAESPVVPMARQDDLFYFMRAMTIVFDTGVAVNSIDELLPAVAAMTTGSIHYHFIEARRRPDIGYDDFSTWLMPRGHDAAILGEQLRAFDFYYLSLREVKERLCDAIRAHLTREGIPV